MNREIMLQQLRKQQEVNQIRNRAFRAAQPQPQNAQLPGVQLDSAITQDYAGEATDLLRDVLSVRSNPSDVVDGLEKQNGLYTKTLVNNWSSLKSAIESMSERRVSTERFMDFLTGLLNEIINKQSAAPATVAATAVAHPPPPEATSVEDDSWLRRLSNLDDSEFHDIAPTPPPKKARPALTLEQIAQKFCDKLKPVQMNFIDGLCKQLGAQPNTRLPTKADKIDFIRETILFNLTIDEKSMIDFMHKYMTVMVQIKVKGHEGYAKLQSDLESLRDATQGKGLSEGDVISEGRGMKNKILVGKNQKYFIDAKQLHHGFLTIRYVSNHHQLPIKSQMLSEIAKNLVLQLAHEGKVDKVMYHKLMHGEKHLLNVLANRFGLDLGVDDDNSFQEKWAVVRGEILSGNDSNALKSEASKMLLYAKDVGIITAHQMWKFKHELGL
jgi:hypothetical protein